ncbi:MAG TPA: hypothetical protein VK629_17115, partial [Steroidobacteraceae bacterium]|nr:hypothetical protein [Steroidobacteraceae bacterium]
MPQSPSESLVGHLQAGVASAAELETALEQSQSTVSRNLRQLAVAGTVIRIGSTRGARYGMLRPIEGIGAKWPLRRIDAEG